MATVDFIYDAEHRPATSARRCEGELASPCKAPCLGAGAGRIPMNAWALTGGRSRRISRTSRCSRVCSMLPWPRDNSQIKGCFWTHEERV